jgi:hypothetical protein
MLANASGRGVCRAHRDKIIVGHGAEIIGAVPSAKIAFGREGTRVTQFTVADPEVMLTARRD